LATWRTAVLVATHATALTAILTLGTLAWREDRLLRALWAEATQGARHDVDRIVAARSAIYRAISTSPVRAWDLEAAARLPLLRSASAHLLDANSCASFAFALAATLRTAQVPARICQMQMGRKPAKHMLVEAWVDGGWRCLDPAFDVSWVRPDGSLASCEDVASDWPAYSQQPAPNTQPLTYPSSYDRIRYVPGGIRHTNWQAIPVLLPALRSVLAWWGGEAWADGLSLRVLVLNQYRVAAGVGVALEAVVLGAWWRARRRARQRSAPSP
jgi:hypothetical protein